MQVTGSVPQLSQKKGSGAEGGGRCLPKPQSSGNARGQDHSRDTRTLPPIHLQGCRAPVGAPATLGAGPALCPGTRRPFHLFSTLSTPRVPEGQACPSNRELSATSCVSKSQGPQQHWSMLPWSYTPEMPVPSQKPLGVTLPWGQRLVSSPEMPWAGGFARTGSSCQPRAGWKPFTRSPGLLGSLAVGPSGQ